MKICIVYNGATLANKVCYADFQPLSFFVAAHRQDSITVSDQPHTLQVDMVTLTTVCKTISFHSMKASVQNFCISWFVLVLGQTCIHSDI